MSRIARTGIRMAVVVSVLCAGFLAILFSPLLLRSMATFAGDSWAELGNIGQSYGFASALLSGFAFVGILITILLQVREARTLRIESHRPIHMELSRMAIDDESLLACWSIPRSEMPAKRRYLYMNLMMNAWAAKAIHAGIMNEDDLRFECAYMFKGAAGREYWAEARPAYLGIYKKRKERRFYGIVDEEYWKAINSGPAIPVADGPERVALSMRMGMIGTTCVAAGFAIAYFSERRKTS